MMNKITLLFLTALYVPGQAQPTDSLRLHVMTFNILFGTANYGDHRWELRRTILFDLLKKESPDIIGLQEALRHQIDEIRDALPSYDETGVGRDDGKTAGEFSAILYRRDRFQLLAQETFWFSDSPAVPGSMTWGNAYPRICSWVRLVEKNTGRSFYVYNVHLDHISQESREKSMDLLRHRIAARTPPEPFIVMGDFNAGERNRAIKLLKTGFGEFELVDSYRIAHPDEKEVGTFHAFKGTTTGEKIDYIFVTPNIVVSGARILRDSENGRYPSDHFPVDVRLIIPPAPRE